MTDDKFWVVVINGEPAWWPYTKDQAESFLETYLRMGGRDCKISIEEVVL